MSEELSLALEGLEHWIKKTPGGADIILVNTGALITPEDIGMLQALHSRNPKGFLEHMKTLIKKGGSGSFMKKFYIGYGHKSIGDGTTVTLFIEGVSMLAAKAIQDWQLYTGQECSTRYLDFSNQHFINPLNSEAGTRILEDYRSFYMKATPEVVAFLKEEHPYTGTSDTDRETYLKAIDAGAFDILRGFLPAGSSTNLSWHTNVRQAADKLLYLRHHPLQEVRDIAEALESVLMEGMPNSFTDKKYEKTEEYMARVLAEEYYYNPTMMPYEFALTAMNMNTSQLPYWVLRDRPEKTELPKHLDEAGTMQFEFLLDFGSYRDIQRHRSVVQRMPLLSTRFGFEKWYMGKLPEKLQERALDLLELQESRLEVLCSDEVKQYYCAMGYRVPNRITGPLRAMVYIAELRATRFVHPTARHIATQVAGILEENFKKYGLVLHLDKEPGMFDLKRGTQDIKLID